MEPGAGTDKIWSDFTDRVTATIGELEPGEYLVLVAPPNRYVQVSVQDFAIRVESVSDQYLHPGSGLDADQVRELRRLGFDPPSHPAEVDAEKSEGSSNWWLELETTATQEQVAGLLVEALRRVHRVGDPKVLTYDCGAVVEGHIPQPRLRLPRTRSPEETARWN